MVHTAWVFFPRGFGYLTAGVVATIKTALPFQNYMLPKTPTLVLFLFFVSPVFFFFGLVLSRVCVMFTSLNLKPVLLQNGGLTLWHRTVTEQGLRLVFTSVKNRKESGKANLSSSNASERMKEMQCLLLHYI